MEAETFERLLATLGVTQAEFADAIGISPRTARLYASDGVSYTPVIILLRLLKSGKITLRDISKAKGRS